MSFLKSATVLSTTILLAAAAQAQCSGELLIANDHGAADYFGYSMAAEGNRLVIGAYGDDLGAVSNAGSVYVFVPWIDGYGQYQKITAGAGTSNANFGKAVDLDSNQLVIGAPGVTVSGQGAAGEVRVYTLQGNSFVFSASIPNPDPAAAEGFGEDVAIWQDQLMIGCPGSDEGGTDRGAVYFYKRINGTWTLMNKIIPPSNQNGARAGAIIDMWGDAAVVGLPTHDSPGYTDDGAIVVYKRLADGHWTQDFFGIGEYDGERQGASVALGEHVLLAGSPGRGYIEPGVGMVHVWYNQDETGTKIQWTPFFIQNYISATDFTAGNGFGNSMSISGNRVIIGSAAGTVRAAEFEIDPLTRDRKVVRNFRSVAGGSAQYGSSVALVGDLAAIGDPGLLYQGEVSMGAVRMYDRSQMGGSDHPYYPDTPLIGLGSYNGCTEFATRELPASNRCGQSDNSPDVYFRLHLTSTGTFIADTEGSSYDTVLGVADEGWNFTCDDDSGTGQMSRIVFDNVGETQRLIRVSGYNGAAGAFVLNISATCGSSDFNHDGDYGTDSDIEAFFACLGGNCCSTCGNSDFNADGDFGTDADIEAFFRVLAGGAC